MRIYYGNNEWRVSDRSKDIPLREFTELKRIEQGISISKLESVAGIAHPSYKNYATGSTRGGLTGLIVLEALGYELYIFGSVKDSVLRAEGVAK